MPVIYQFSYDSPVRYLPLAYLLPYGCDFPLSYTEQTAPQHWEH